jgi:hypothetical protein
MTMLYEDEEKYPKGSRVRIADRAFLEEFLETWKHHHKLQAIQLDFADRIAEVEAVGFYHGGDVLYRLEGIPGTWHERCLRPWSEP